MVRASIRSILLATAAVALLGGCSADSGRAQACVPGKTEECLCGPGQPGVQTCLPGGSGFDECRCGAGDAPGADSGPAGQGKDTGGATIPDRGTKDVSGLKDPGVSVDIGEDDIEDVPNDDDSGTVGDAGENDVAEPEVDAPGPPDTNDVGDAGPEPSPCDGIGCSGHGHCIDGGGAAVCVCDPGYYHGASLQECVDPCEGITCSGRGTCTAQENGIPICECQQGFRPVGAECVVDETDCLRVRMLESRVFPEEGSAVAMFFTVDTCTGLPVTDLTQDDFEILEDGSPVSTFESAQTLLPRTGVEPYVALLLDTSGSVQASGALPQLVESAKLLTDKLTSQPALRVRVALLLFDGSEEIAEWQTFTSDGALLAARLDALETYTPADPSTNLNGAVVQALEHLDTVQAVRRAAMRGGVFTSGTLVLFTDGTDQAGRVPAATACTGVNTSSNSVLAVGMGGEIDTEELARLGRDGVVTAGSQEDLATAFLDLATKVQGQVQRLYLLGYCSPKRAGPHNVTVRVQNVSTYEFSNCELDSAACGCTTACANDAECADHTHEDCRSMCVDGRCLQWCDVSIGASFDARGFNAGCGVETFTSACEGQECGGLGCGGCDYGTACDPTALGCCASDQDCVRLRGEAPVCMGWICSMPQGCAQHDLPLDIRCKDGNVCSNGQCVPPCQSECGTRGDKRCGGEGVQTCGDFDDDECLEWDRGTPCRPGRWCFDGACEPLCNNECAPDGRKCEGSGYRVCGDYDSDPCLEWSMVAPCGPGEVCDEATGACESEAAECEHDSGECPVRFSELNAGVLRARCAPCHTEGAEPASAPKFVDDYVKATGQAPRSAECAGAHPYKLGPCMTIRAVETATMPPPWARASIWLGDQMEAGEYTERYTLSEEEKLLIVRWVEDGMLP